ncbi:MAG: PAS domain S-box protein [Pseudomonadota bacterium]
MHSYPALQSIAEALNEPGELPTAHELQPQEFYKFFQMSTDLMIIGQLGGRILKVNQGTVDALGYSEEEFRNLLVIEIVHADDRRATLAELERQMKTGTSVDFENRCVCKDGSYRWLSWRARFDHKSGLSYATARDITESKRIQEELRQQQIRYNALVDNTTDVIMEFDRAHRHTYCNKAVIAAIGLTPEAFIGKTHEEMGFPKHLCDIWEHAIERVFVTGQPYTTYFEADNPGGLMKVDWSVFPGIVIDGEVITVLNVSRDITQYRKVEEELARMQKLNSLGVLAGGIAHDFNNILTILFGNISLAKSLSPIDHKSYMALEQAEVAFQRATHLTSQLLTFAKGGEPVVQDVSISSLIDEVVHFDLSGSNVRLELNRPADLWQARVDTGQISQVFSNLAMNAKQAMPDGGHLYISVENCTLQRNDVPGIEDGGKYLKFIVRDEGCGIGEEDIDKIFDPYFSTKKKGSGLGLATVYSIINRHGGHISVESTVDVGTAFTLYLPASEEAANDETPLVQAAVAAEPGQARLLVMDDEDMIGELCITYLSMKGYEVHRAKDGKEAIEMYGAAVKAGKAYDCMIMDLTIPGGMSGEVALVQIQQQHPSARAIVSSGYAADPVMANYKSHGFSGRISKPFRLASLEEEIRRVLTESLAG